MASQNGPTNDWNNTCAFLLIITRMIGTDGYHWCNILSTHGQMLQQRKPPLNSSGDMYHESIKPKGPRPHHPLTTTLNKYNKLGKKQLKHCINPMPCPSHQNLYPIVWETKSG